MTSTSQKTSSNYYKINMNNFSKLLVILLLITCASCTKTIPCSECGSKMHGTNVKYESETVQRYICNNCSYWEIHWDGQVYLTPKGYEEYQRETNEIETIMSEIQSSASISFEEKDSDSTESSDQMYNTWQIRYKLDDLGYETEEPYMICTIPSIVTDDQSTSTKNINSHISLIVQCNNGIIEVSPIHFIFVMTAVSEPVRDKRNDACIEFNFNPSHSGLNNGENKFSWFLDVEDIHFIKKLNSPIKVSYKYLYDETIHGSANLPTKGFKETYAKFLNHPYVQDFIENYMVPNDIPYPSIFTDFLRTPLPYKYK